MEALVEKGAQALAGLVRWVRGERAMLDADLARLYGVETKALKRAVNRNRKRFPRDFVFLLKKEELTNLRYQIGTSSLGWGGSFAEDGRSEMGYGGGREREGERERREKRYDEQFRTVFQAIQELIAEENEPRRKIGFGAESGK